jgi:tetratricopeptide (TPR) repeat protein
VPSPSAKQTGGQNRRIIKVFIASPGDLTVERRAFKDTIDELNRGFGRGADVEFVPLGWEDALSQVGRRSQASINADVDACDVFVLAMWRRWGQEAPDASPYTSYTEEEFYRALFRFEESGVPEIFVFFKHIDPGQMADAGPQLAKVLEFRRKLEQTRKVLYRPFTDEAAFRVEIDKHLVAFARGEIEKPSEDKRVPLLPDPALEKIAKAKAEAKRALEEAERARAEAKDAQARAEAAESVAEAKAARNAVTLAEKAAQAALEGKIEEARQDFAKALDGTMNLRVLYLGFDFFNRIGDLNEARRLLRRWLAISGPEAQTADTAAAYGNLGLIYWRRGDLDQAEAMHRKSLAIEEKLGRLEGVAIQYGNLGLIYRRRRDLDQAEAMHRKSLAINEKLGRLEGMAANYGNLGSIAVRRGNISEARTLWTKSRGLYANIGMPHMVKKVQSWLNGPPK